MSAHIIHESIETHGLADDCPRCREHADSILTLDNENLEALVRRTRQWRQGAAAPRSTNELRAMRQIDRHLTILNRIEPFLNN